LPSHCSIRARGERRCEVWGVVSEANGEWDGCVLYLWYEEEGRSVKKRKRVGRENVK